MTAHPTISDCRRCDRSHRGLAGAVPPSLACLTQTRALRRVIYIGLRTWTRTGVIKLFHALSERSATRRSQVT